jgi:hypothetical protein
MLRFQASDPLYPLAHPKASPLLHNECIPLVFQLPKLVTHEHLLPQEIRKLPLHQMQAHPLLS